MRIQKGKADSRTKFWKLSQKLDPIKWNNPTQVLEGVFCGERKWVGRGVERVP